jgi:hypothetical protein
MTEVMNAEERLKAALAAADAGRHAEALKGYLWFYHHALEESKSQAVVRLSIGLEAWMELAGEYPPARAALKEVRDYKTQRLETDFDNLADFEDIAAINECLGNEEATYDLFCTIVARDRKLAARYERWARPAILKAKNFKLARSFLGDVEKGVATLTYIINHQIKIAFKFENEAQRKMELKWSVDYFVNAVIKLKMIIIRAKSGDDIETLITEAIAKITNVEVQEMVRQQIALADDDYA